MRIYFGVFLVPVLAFWAGAASAGSPEECQTYATAAMKQVEENAALSCGLSGGNWSNIRDAHLAYCLQVDASKYNVEWEARENELKGCRCNTYATAAMRQVSENTQLGCGLSGGNWANDANAHRDYCMQNPTKFNAEWEFRQNEINQCKVRLASTGGGTTRTVSEPTDLYDARQGNKVGNYLAPGLQVTTVGVCGNDWCELSSPKGWVWGGHLK